MQEQSLTTDSAASDATIAAAYEKFTVADGSEAAFQLTDAVLKNLTHLELSNVSLFLFANEYDASVAKAANSTICKTFPGDSWYPSELVWEVFDLLTGGALIKTVPIGAACYPGDYYNATYCQFLIDNYNSSDTL